jgi:hypothetical protein
LNPPFPATRLRASHADHHMSTIRSTSLAVCVAGGASKAKDA